MVTYRKEWPRFNEFLSHGLVQQTIVRFLWDQRKARKLMGQPTKIVLPPYLAWSIKHFLSGKEGSLFTPS